MRLIKFLKSIKSSFKNKKPRIIPVPKIGGILLLLPILTVLGALSGIASGGWAIAKVLNDVRNRKEQGYDLYLPLYPKN